MREFSFNMQNEIIFNQMKFSIKKIDDLLLIILKENSGLDGVILDNVIAVSNETGKIIWQVENYQDSNKKSSVRKDLGAFIGALPYSDKDYIVLTKAHGWKVLVNKKDGRIVRDIDLNIGNRPW